MARKFKSKIDRTRQFHIVYRDWFESDAYRSLNCVQRSLLHELHALYLPSRNDVFLSTRRAAKRLHVNADTARKAFHVLENRGFIKLINGHLWQQRKARTWRLTFMSYNNREPTDDWAAYSD